MGTLTIAETARFLAEHDRYAIVTHRRPDGDTLGSAATLCRGLQQLGKTAWVLENPEVTEKYQALLTGLTKSAPEEADILLCVDVASANMLPDAYRDGCFALRIDHHGTADSFTQQELVQPQAAACGQIVYRLLQTMGATLDVPMAEALYTAISTDTGCFRYANTQPETFRVAADCGEAGADLFRLNQVLFETTSLGRLKIQSWMTEHARFSKNGQVCVCAIPLEVERQLHLCEDDMENISGFPRSIAGVKLAATLRVQPDGVTKISVRAVPGFDAGAVCAQFGGGGHLGAAGASLDLPLEDAAQKVQAALDACL